MFFFSQRRRDAELGIVMLSRKGTGVQAQSLGRVILSRKDAKARSLRDVFFTQRHRGALAELGRMCFFSQSRRDAELGRVIWHAEAPGCKRKVWEELFCHAKTQRRGV
jgi:hypothetical protein